MGGNAYGRFSCVACQWHKLSVTSENGSEGGYDRSSSMESGCDQRGSTVVGGTTWANTLLGQGTKKPPGKSGRLAFNLLKRSCASKIHSWLEVRIAGNAMLSHIQSFLLFLFANPQPNGELQESKHNQ